MALPSSKDARLFYRCARQRCEEAEVLLGAGYSTGAVYLAGYGVECMLKALVLEAAPAKKRTVVLASFHGRRAHEYEWLRDLYSIRTGARLPHAINRQFALVNGWSTDLRYTPRTIDLGEARAFLIAAAAILDWADGRF